MFTPGITPEILRAPGSLALEGAGPKAALEGLKKVAPGPEVQEPRLVEASERPRSGGYVDKLRKAGTSLAAGAVLLGVLAGVSPAQAHHVYQQTPEVVCSYDMSHCYATGRVVVRPVQHRHYEPPQVIVVQPPQERVIIIQQEQRRRSDAAAEAVLQGIGAAVGWCIITGCR